MMSNVLVFIVVCLSTFYTCLAQYNVVCAEGRNNVSLSPSTDGVLGRYTVEYCLKTRSDIVWWQSILTVDIRPASKCIEYVSQLDRAQKHSIFEYIIDEHLNCSNVCLSKSVDLIYAGCYTMKMQVKHKLGTEPKYVLQRVDNGLTIMNFTQTQVLTHTENQQHGVLIKFYFKNIPITDFNIELCNNTHTHCAQIEHMCDHSTYIISCLVYNISEGTYTAYLTLESPWTQGDVIPNIKHTTRVTFDYVPSMPSVPVVTESMKSVWVTVLCVCALCVCVLMCACVCVRRKGAHTFKGLVVQQWRQRYAEVSKRAESVALSPDSNGLLLLYARDCQPFMAAIDTLKQALRETLDCKLYDLFEPSTVSELCMSPAQWLQRCITTCNVLLVETCAAEHLYNANGNGLTLSSPLLGSVALYKNAQPGDSYLQYCLALIRDNAHRTNAYNKYYIARVQSMRCDMLPAVVPHTRYTLPEHLPTLLAQLQRHTSPARTHTPTDTYAQLHAHLNEYIQYVNDNPNYLKDELMFL